MGGTHKTAIFIMIFLLQESTPLCKPHYMYAAYYQYREPRTTASSRDASHIMSMAERFVKLAFIAEDSPKP